MEKLIQDKNEESGYIQRFRVRLISGAYQQELN